MSKRLAACNGRGFPRLPWPPSAPSLAPRTIKPERTPMARLKFGAFLAPHHPIGEHPMLQFRRDLDLRRAARRARLRRVLVRRASLLGLGNHRLAGDVSGRRRRAHQAHQARHRRGLAALSPSLQRRAAHGAARPHDRRPRHLRLRPGRAGFRRAYARHRSDDAARPPGRGDRRSSAACSTASASPPRATGSP